MSQFTAAADELRALGNANPPPHDRQANDQINAICADAVRRYQALAKSGVPGFNAALIFDPYPGAGPPPFVFNGVPRHDARPWLNIAEHLSTRFPDDVPPNPSLPCVRKVWGEQITFPSTSGTSISGEAEPLYTEISYPPEGWRERTRNYARCMEVLARLEVAGGESIRIKAAPSAAGNQPEAWLTVTQVAHTTGLSQGEVSRLCDKGTLTTNGLKRKQRRIDPASVTALELRLHQEGRVKLVAREHRRTRMKIRPM